MLGRLARWLRMMGYDTLYAREEDDSTIVELSSSQRRIILTRDRQLTLRKGVDALFVSDSKLEAQMSQVAEVYSLHFREDLMRCSECNGSLVKAAGEELRDLVPDGVLSRFSDFQRCSACGKVYWKGSHWERILAVLDAYR